MHARNLGEAFEMIMIDRGWSQTRLGRELGASQSWVSRVVNGVLDPGTRTASGKLAKVGWQIRITPEPEEDDPLNRREFVAGAASVLFVPSPTATPFHDPSYVALLTRRTARIHSEIGGDSLSATLIAQARKIQAASANGARELLLAASEFFRHGAYVLRSAGNNDVAVKFAENAVAHARLAGSPEKQGIAQFALVLASAYRCTDHTVSTFRGNSEKAVMYAQHGLRIPEISDETRAYLNACLACGLANIPGREREARAAVERALSAEKLPAIERADILGFLGKALCDMKAYREALATFDDAARLSAPLSPFYQAFGLADQVPIALRIHEPSRAASAMEALSYAVPLVDSAEVGRQVRHVLRLSRPWTTVPEVRAARERLLSVLA